MPPPGTLHGLCRVTPQLYLSNMRAASDASALQRCGITCVINASETRTHTPPGVDYLHVPVADSPSTPLCDHFHRVADKIDEVCREEGRALVHCNAGVSRSAALCMAYLMKHRGQTLLQAHGWVKACRPVVRPNVGFWKQLIAFEAELRGGRTTVRMVSSSIGEIPDVYEEETKNMVPL